MTGSHAAVKLDWTMLHQLRSDTAVARIVSKFPDVFQKGVVGCIRVYTLATTIRLKENVKPIFKKSHSVVYALQPALEVELE